MLLFLNLPIYGKSIIRLTEDRIISAEELFAEINKYGNIIAAGDYAEEFIKKYPADNVSPAPPHLRLQLASSLCFAAFDNELSSPDSLNAEYLQITKAEKDLQN